MAKTYITDIKQFLDQSGEPKEMPSAASRMADFLASIIDAVTRVYPTVGHDTGIRCRKRGCKAPIQASLHTLDGKITWWCPICEQYGLISGWQNNLGRDGQVFAGWDQDVAYLKQRGFKVVQHGWYQAVVNFFTPPPGAPDYYLRDQVSASQFQAEAISLSQSGELHGLYFWGHGWDSHFGGVQYASLSQGLAYRLGLVVINACRSNYGPQSGQLLVSENGILGGAVGTLAPAGAPDWVVKLWQKERHNEPKDTVQYTYSKPISDYLHPGDQGTRP